MPIAADHHGDLAILRDQLAAAQLAQVAHRRRAIILFEGPEGAGKKFALRQLAGAFDPCHTKVVSVNRDRREAADGHWLARFWRDLPAAGESVFFYRSWYRRVLDERLSGRVEDGALARSFDEINEFEAQQRDYGTLIVKLYFDVSAQVQAQRLAERSMNPWQGGQDNDATLAVAHPGYAQALEDLRDNSDTRWSPWRILDGNDEGTAAAEALAAVLEDFRAAMPAEPPHLVKADNRAA
ncbi:MAG: polyphosphate kinase [Pseudomonadota bacterium]